MIRNHLLDNAKYIFILLVVFGHFIEALIDDNQIIKIVYLSIYSFHMPAFIILTGMLSKAHLSQIYVTKLVKSILIPFIVFTIFYELFYYIAKGEWSDYIQNLQPYWMLWFLYSLIIWKLFLPIILNFKFPILYSLIIAIGAGYAESIGYFLGLSRTIYFFPFFIIGYQLSPQVCSRIYSKVNSKILILISSTILILNIVFFIYYQDMSYEWLYGSLPYSALTQMGWMAGLIRGGFYIISFSTVIAILCLIPSQKIKILSQGENSLYVYLWHGFFVKIFSGLGIINVIGNFPTIISLLILFGISTLLTFILSRCFVASNTQRFIINPVSNLLLNSKY